SRSQMKKRKKLSKRERMERRLQHANTYQEGFEHGFQLGLQVAGANDSKYKYRCRSCEAQFAYAEQAEYGTDLHQHVNCHPDCYSENFEYKEGEENRMLKLLQGTNAGTGKSTSCVSRVSELWGD